MPKITFYICIAFAWFTCGNGFAQKAWYNLNSNNGLPSDNVYCIYIDKKGYMWIGTDNGVIKYNGYTFRKFDISTGISDADVWNFFEDSRGRLWLYRIADEVGYIANDKYYKVHIKDLDGLVFYPKYIRERGDSITFLTVDKKQAYLCIINNDTLQSNKLTRHVTDNNHFINPEGKILTLDKGVIWHVTWKDGNAGFIEKCNFKKYPRVELVNNFLLPSQRLRPEQLSVFDIENCRERLLPFDSHDLIYNSYEQGQQNYLITQKYAYVFDSANYSRKPLSTLIPREYLQNNQVSYLINDSIWGACIATTKTGMYISYALQTFPQKTGITLKHFKNIGTDKGYNHYWWNDENRTLVQMKKNGKPKFRKLQNTDCIGTLIPYSKNKMIVVADNYVGLIDKKSLSVSDLSKNVRYYITNYVNEPEYSTASVISETNRSIIPGGQYGIYNDSVFLLIIRGHGFVQSSYCGDTLINTCMSLRKYNGLLYAPFYKSYIAYSTNSVVVRAGDTTLQINEAELKAAGINQIEKIISDSLYGNFFIRDHNRIILCNFHTNTFKEIFNRYRSEHARIHIHHNVLVIAVKSGILLCKIEGPGKIGNYILYPNTKETLYKSLYDITAVNDKVFFNTDNGLFSIPLPGDHIFRNKTATANRHYFILNYNNELRRVNRQDTIWLDASKPDLLFDVINPAGIGSLKIEAMIQGRDSAWKNLNGYELHLAGINPGQYYLLLLKARDDAWESFSVPLVLYMVPSFWQTALGTTVKLITAGIIFLLIVFLIIYYTRRIVSKSHLKKNYLLSLELKAIYAQINPHFIFNTLNTGLYFINENRNQEAYTHISSFSQLLRSYIKSSRSKYVPLSDEIEALKTYITLQQQRFEDRFDFIVEVGKEINTREVFIPALLLQPFIENAINHGLLHKTGKGCLKISFSSDNENEITCIIDDNGIGRAKSLQINQDNPHKPKSYGNQLIEDLIKVINSDNVVKISIHYLDKLEPDTGTSVFITIKKHI